MGSVGQFPINLGPNRGFPRDLQSDASTIIGIQYLTVMAAEQRLYRAHVGVITLDERRGLLMPDLSLEPLEGCADATTIGLDQTAGTQQHTTVVAHNNGGYLTQS